MKELHVHFWTKCSTSLVFQSRFSSIKVQNSEGISKIYVKKHWYIIALLHDIILKQMGWPNEWCKRWSEDCGSMAFEKATLEIGTCSYHGWPWDIGSPHWHLFHHTFYYLVKTRNYQPPFDVMLWLWLVLMILQCGFRHVSNKLLCLCEWCLWLWRIWQLFSIRILFGMPQFVEEVDLRFIGLS